MVSLLITAPERERDLILADLLDAGTLGCTEESEGLRAFFADRAAAEPMALRYSVAEVREEKSDPIASDILPPADPILAGERFFIVPGEFEGHTPAGRLRLTVDAGSAFGTGRHESTHLMLEALESRLTPGMEVADIGSGSGILSQAARLLGAARLTLCDIDEIFLGTLPGELRSRAFVGSADGIRTQSADIVVANISAKVLDLIAYDLNRIARPNGCMILSGFIRDRLPTCFRPIAETRRGDWLCWICAPQAVETDRRSPVIHSLQWY